MKTLRKLTAATLTMALLLSLLGGATAFAATVTTQGETAYVPLGQTGAVVYERHEAGYTVALSPAGDGVSVNLSAVPGEEAARAPEQARVYVRTGVTPKAGTAYEVSFALTAAAAQPEYAVRFDGGETPGAYGALEGRAIQAGETDRVRQTVRPQGESGELVVCLLLGKTGPEGNTLRLTDLTVAEAAPDGAAKTTVLVDKLDYRAPGFIRAWTNSDSAADLTSTEDSATLTVTKAPDPAEVWKTKLLVATGLKPQAGKTYFVSFDLKGSEVRPFEICYNEGDTEKGYDVLYSQTLTTAVQTIQRRIYIPRDKTNAGEIIVQLSLGMLKVGDSATVSNVRVEEEIPRYTNILPNDFNFEDHSVNAIYRHTTKVTSANTVPVDINWNGGASVTAAGGTLTTQDGAATLKIDTVGTEGYEAKLVVDTGMALETGKTYRVSFDLHSQEAYTAESGGFALLYGTAAGWPNDRVYGEAFGQTIDADATVKRTLSVTPAADGLLVISLELGRTQVGNEVTVSNFKIEEMIPGQAGDEDLAQVKYPGDETSSDPGGEPVYDPGSFSARDGHGSISGGGENFATMTCEDVENKWEKGMFIGGEGATLCTLEAGYSYKVTFGIQTDGQEITCNVSYNKDKPFGEGYEKGFGEQGGIKVSTEVVTVEQTITPTANGGLCLFLEFPDADTGTQVTVRDVQVDRLDEETPGGDAPGGDVGEQLGDNMASVTYPTEGGSATVTDPGSFSARDGHGSISAGGENFATMTCEDVENTWEKGMFIGGEGATLCTLEVGHSYKVTFGIQTDGQEITCNVSYNKDKPFGEGNEKGFGEQGGIKVSTELVTVEQTITPTANGGLCLFLEFPDADTGTQVTVRDIQVERLDEDVPGESTGEELGDNVASVTYPAEGSPATVTDPGSFSTRDSHGSISGGGENFATMTCEDVANTWEKGMFIGGEGATLCDLEAGHSYEVTFGIQTDGQEITCNVSYNKDKPFGEGNEKGFGEQRDIKVSTELVTVEQTITPEASGGLCLFLEFPDADTGTQVTVRDVQVERLDEDVPGESTGEELGDNVASVTYPAEGTPATVTDPGSFSTRDSHGSISDGGENFATMTCEDVENKWEKGMFIGGEGATLCDLEAGHSYEVTFGIQTDGQEITCNVSYNKDKPFGEGNENGFGSQRDIKVSTEAVTVTQPITPEASGGLCLFLEFPDADTGTQVTISNIQVREVLQGGSSGGSSSGDPFAGAAVTYPTTTSGGGEPTPGSFSVRENNGSIVFSGADSATMICEDVENKWEKGMFVGGEGATLCTLEAGHSYQVSFDLQTDGQEITCNVSYNKDKPFGEGNENGFGSQRDIKVSTEAVTVTQPITPEASGGLCLFLEFPDADTGTQVTISNIQVREVLQGGSSGGSSSGEDFAGAAVTYPTTTTGGGEPSPGSFEVRDSLGTVASNGDQSATITWPQGSAELWQLNLFINELCQLQAGTRYQVSFDVAGDQDYDVLFYTDGNKYEDDQSFASGAIAADASSFSQEVTPTAAGQLTLRIKLTQLPGSDGSQLTISNIQVREVRQGGSSGGAFAGATVTYPHLSTSGGGGGAGGHSFEARDSLGTIADGGDRTATVTWPAEDPADLWRLGLFVNEFCQLKAGTNYEVSFDIVGDQDYNISFYTAGNKYDNNARFANGTAVAGKGSFSQVVTPTADGSLTLRIDPTQMPHGSQLTIRNIKVVQAAEYTVGETTTIDRFNTSGVSMEIGEGYTGQLARHSDSVDFVVTRDGTTGPDTWRAKLCIDTGLTYQPGKDYRFKFDISSTDGCSNFCVITKGAVNPDDDMRGTWSQSVKAGTTKTVVTRPMTAGRGSGALGIDIELGNFPGSSNTYTVSNLVLEEVVTEVDTQLSWQRSSGGEGVNVDAQRGYVADLTRNQDSATLNLIETPTSGAEAWKLKLFINPDIDVVKDQAVRVTFDVTAENDMDFEVCYNRNGIEKGFDAVYGLHLAAGQVKTVEKVFTAQSLGGKMIVQLSLGMVQAPNRITVQNLQVENVSYTPSGVSALPAPADYHPSTGDVTYWAHADYAVDLLGSPSAVTAQINSAPQLGAEPWKIKLFLDTHTALQPGKFYRVTADLAAAKGQTIEICYNNGDVEMGYDSLTGIGLAAGQIQTVERVISVPADKADLRNLMLQFNLGQTTAANEVTVSGITVEEVTPTYAELIAPNFAYTPGGTVQLWTNPDCTADVACADGSVTTHVTAVPAGGAEVWKVQTRVRTGAILTPGKTYLVRADLLADQGQNFEVCYNNEETEKGYDALYGQTIAANTKTTVERKISVPATMTDAGELVLQFSIGGATPNNVTVSNISVQELSYGAAAAAIAPQAVVALDQADGAGTLTVTREALTYQLTQVAPEAGRNAIRLQGADLRSNERYTVSFTARSPEGLSGTLLLRSADGKTTALSGAFQATAEGAPVQFTTGQPLAEGGAYDLLWQFGGAENQARGGGTVELSNILLSVPAETLNVTRSTQKVTVNGRAVTPDAYAINGYNYFKLRDLATILNGTDAQFVVRYNAQNNAVSLTTGKPYTPVGGELTVGADLSAQCVRSGQSVAVDGQKVNLKVYSIGGYNYFRVRDLDRLLGYQVEYVPQTDTVAITSARTPEAQEQAHSYDLFFRPEIDGESQGYVGDTMPFYEDGTYYIYYLKEGGDAYNHSVYLTTTTDFVHYTELGEPVLSASREDVQDSWIGTGSVVKVEGSYYFFYTGFNSSGSQEYHEKIMVAKGSSPTAFTKVAGWEITPPDELGQKNDFRDPQAYYDPATGTISLTITASQGGRARVLKYTLDKDLKNATYDGIIYTDHTGAYWNLECSDTFRMGNKWYLTFSGQNDTVWYAMADSRFGPYTAPARLDGKIFYAAKHVEDGTNTYMVGWAHRSDPVTSTQSVDGWAGNLEVQQVKQNSDGTLTLVPVEAILGQFTAPAALSVPAETTVTASAQRVCQPAFLCGESFLLRGSFTYTGEGAFGLAFDFDGAEGGQKLISLDPKAGKLTLSFQGGDAPIAEIPAALQAGRTYSFTYVQDGSVGIFYLDGQAALTVRLYGTADKTVSLFAENNAVTFSALELLTR